MEGRETHNHPTAIPTCSRAPPPARAARSSRRGRHRPRLEAEGGPGPGSRCRILRLPGALRPWEKDHGKPERIASALDIMIDGPLGGAAFNNEFGRPNICGVFRTFELEVPAPGNPQTREVRGYHKPIMIAGGLGNIRPDHVQKHEIPPGAAVIVVGGPALLIGLGGGAASSVASGASAEEDLDFASRCNGTTPRCSGAVRR